jgi:hypothetical protein
VVDCLPHFALELGQTGAVLRRLCGRSSVLQERDSPYDALRHPDFREENFGCLHRWVSDVASSLLYFVSCQSEALNEVAVLKLRRWAEALALALRQTRAVWHLLRGRML